MKPTNRHQKSYKSNSYRGLLVGVCFAAAASSGCGSSSSGLYDGMGGIAGQTTGGGASAKAGSPAANSGASGKESAGMAGAGGLPDMERAGGAGQDAGAAGLDNSAGAGGNVAGAGGKNAGGTAGFGAAGETGGAAGDLQCIDFESLTLSDFKLSKAAGASGTAEFSATLNNLSNRFIDYTGGVLTCTEQGTLVDSVSAPNWSFGIVAKGTQSLTFSAKLNTAAPSGAAIHCTAHAAQLAAKDCANAAQETIEFKVQ